MATRNTPVARRAAAKGASGTVSKKEVAAGDAAKALKALRAGEWSPELAEAAGFHIAHRMERPTAGRLVMFHSSANDAELEPAIVTKGSTDPRGRISLVVFGESTTRRERDVAPVAAGEERSWSWPERVEAHTELVPMTAAQVAHELARQDAGGAQ
jgi:hypothetical protein